MKRYQVGDEVQVIGRGLGRILAVARPGHALEVICGPVMVQLGRLALQGKRFSLPTPNDEAVFRGAVTQYLVESDDRVMWVGWHLVRRVRSGVPGHDVAFMDWLHAQVDRRSSSLEVAAA